MAEEVQISNVGGDGVASEVTLQRLVTTMEAMAKKAGIDTKGQAAKLQALYNREIQKAGTVTTAATGATQANTTATKKAAEETNKFARSISNAVATGIGALAASAVGLGKSLWNNETGVQKFTDQLPLIGKALAPFSKYVDESITSFRSLSASGASFGGSITNMRNAAAGMEISLSEMSALFTQQAPALASLGGTVEEGAARFAKMNKNIKASGDFKNLMQMGFSVDQINEGMADYVTLQTRMGTLQGQSTEELAQGSAAYLKQIDLLAKVTGKTREQAKAALEKQAADSVARTLLSQFKKGSKEYENLSTSLALLDEVGGSTADALKGMLTGSPTAAAGELLAVLGDAGPQMAEAMAQIGKGADPQVLLTAMKNAGGELEKFAGAGTVERARIIQQMKAAGNPMADFLDSATKLTDIGNRSVKDAKDQQGKQTAAQDEATATMLTFEQNQRELSAKMHEVFIKSGVLDLIGAGLKFFGEMLKGMADSLSSFSIKIAKGEWFSAIGGILIDGIKGLWNNAGVVAALIGGITLLFAAKAAAGAVTTGIANKVSGLFGGTAAATAKSKTVETADKIKTAAATSTVPAKNAADSGKGVGSAIGNIGSGIGKGLGGILSGLASGISAFANPMVIAGAAALGAAIVLIGGAIAGATWLVGKSLPTMAEGLKSFEALDGQKLIDTGKGMGAIALGMAAFGAGSAVAGLGSLVGGISEGLVSLFGGDNPLTKLQEFQKYDLDAARIENNANALVSYSKGMAALGGSSAVSGIGSVVGAIGSGITALFGADDPLTGLLKFQAYNLDTAKITDNGLAIKAYATAMQNFPASPSVSILSAAKGAIVGLLGGSTDMFAPLIKFGDMKLNTSGVTNNAEAVKAYSNVMKDFPTSPSVGLFTAAKDAIISLLGGSNDTMASIKSFGDMAFNVSGIIGNAKALKAYADAMKDFPASPSVSLFDSFKNGIISFLGGDTNPFAPMMKFGEMKFNTAGIVKNSEAVKSFSTAMSGLASLSTTGNIKIPTLSGLSSLSTISDIKLPTNLASNLDILNKGLDTTGVRTYTKAMEDLVSVLGDLNTELGKDKKTETNKTSARDVVAKTNPQAGGGGGDDQLNSIMNQVLLVLNDMRDLDDKVEKNTRNIIGSNLAQGGVSKIGR